MNETNEPLAPENITFVLSFNAVLSAYSLTFFISFYHS